MTVRWLLFLAVLGCGPVDGREAGVVVDALAVEAPVPDAPVRVNQVGYFAYGPKHATVENDAAESLTWRLVRDGKAVAEGRTEPFGFDPDSGQRVHVIDFSAFHETGDAYHLEVGRGVSPDFALADRPYSRLKVDAVRYFFHNRSGMAIEMPYAGETRWARPAGHAGSDGELGVAGGWYDAGDHGKYVVNAGISVWTLLNLYETSDAESPGWIGDTESLGSGIPESGNGVSDLLDEVRWELEFMLRMQVPPGEANEGEADAGMVRHKIHDEEWTPLPIAPHEAERTTKRVLHPVSTAATLNLAASAAQAARVWREIDADFATRCREAAERAWRAALDHPAVFARWSRGDGGGGAYADDDVSDEFFWAATELWITTGKSEYFRAMKASPFWSEMTESMRGLPTAMTWNQVDALGTLSLLAAGQPAGAQLSESDLGVQRAKLVRAADRFLKLAETQGYGVPFASDGEGGYPWGSNSFVLNNLLILGAARSETGDLRYLYGMVEGMDYLLGRNPLGRSYVTGYGANPVRNPHHRFWAHQADPSFPEPPPGAVSGGPNSRMQDAYIRRLQGEGGLEGCAPQTCFVDHFEAYSVNEVAINWNAPLVWVAAYLDRPEIWLQALAILE